MVLRGRIPIMAVSKNWRYGLAIVSVLILMAASVPLAIWITHTQSAELGNARVRCQRQPQVNHRVLIENDKVKPSHVNAKRCDILTIANLDQKNKADRLWPAR